jgi:signal transduction histidine kinase
MPNILLIEDNPGDALLLREMYRDADVIGDEYNITHVTRVTEAITLLKKRADIDIIISDMSLPDSQGLETLKLLAKIVSKLPVIFMTGTNNEALVSAAIKAGAQDYLVKGHIDSQVLTRTTAYSIERKKAQVEYENAMREVDVLAKSTELLEQQKQQLLLVNQAKDEFISLASHQLRTPATGVKQYLGMILEGYAGVVPSYLQSYLRTAYNSNERQLSIIDDLLKTARIDSGNFSLSKVEYDICELIDEVIQEYVPVTTIRKQKIVYKPTTSCFVKIDVAELKVAIANLIENASKYSPYESTIEIQVKHTKEHIKICVKDSGVGISKKDLSKIFDKFTRIDNELSDTVNGSGLGLYFVKRIIKMHEGTVNVKSELHHGSTFSVALPV